MVSAYGKMMEIKESITIHIFHVEKFQSEDETSQV